MKQNTCADESDYANKGNNTAMSSVLCASTLQLVENVNMQSFMKLCNTRRAIKILPNPTMPVCEWEFHSGLFKVWERMGNLLY